MGTHHDDGYSADISGHLVVGEDRYRLAKTNGSTFTLADPCDLPPGTEGEMLIVVDGRKHSRRIMLPQGASPDLDDVPYEDAIPF